MTNAVTSAHGETVIEIDCSHEHACHIAPTSRIYTAIATLFESSVDEGPREIASRFKRLSLPPGVRVRLPD